MSKDLPERRASETYKRLLGYTFEHKGLYLFGILGSLLYAAMQTAAPEYFRYVLGTIEQADESQKIIAPLVFLGLAIVRGLGWFVSQYAMAYVSRHIVHKLRCQLADKLIRLPIRFFHEKGSGELISTLTYNTEMVNRATTQGPVIIVREGATVIGLISYIFYLNWKLAAIFLVSAPFLGIIVNLATRRFKKFSKRIQVAMGNVTQVTNEIINNQQTIKVYGGTEFESERFRQASDYNMIQSMKLHVTKAVSTPTVQVILSVFIALLIWMAFPPSFFGEIEAKDFVAFLMGAGLLAKPIRQLTNVNPEIQGGIAAAESIFNVLDLEEEKDTGQLAFKRARGDIRFEDVSFRYEGMTDDVLRHIELHIKPGQTVALVGRSGSGKSTLSSLVPRFYDVTSGQIRIDGEPIEAYRLDSLRDQIALVSQKVTLFNCSLRENIAYGAMHGADEAQVIKAAEAAYAMPFIRELPDGLDTYVGEDGIQLSGGQRQRIAIARAILKDAPILILDEATSALDTESEVYIQKALAGIMKNRTTIVIAHRLSTIENADKIVVLDEGRIVETGTHETLIRENGFYAQLHSRQFEEC